VVCGWQPKRAPQEACWYRLIERGFRALAAGPVPFAAIVANPWAETAWCHATPQQRPPEMAKAATAAFTAPSLPIWAGSAPDWRAAAPPPEPDLPMPLAPSRPPDAALGPVPEAASPLAERDMAGQRFRRGKLVHALLQHLPALPPAERPVAARRFLDRPGHALAADDVTAITRDVLAVLAHPFLAPLFGPEGRAEAPLTGVIAGRVVGGLVDRLAVLPDRVLIADYKTNRAPPASPADVPVLYLRQMAAYRAVLAAIHPDRPVACALVWTSGAQVMELPAALLDLHAPGAETHA
jgi:ATP-dependent helicase/nuclease subunit A